MPEPMSVTCSKCNETTLEAPVIYPFIFGQHGWATDKLPGPTYGVWVCPNCAGTPREVLRELEVFRRDIQEAIRRIERRNELLDRAAGVLEGHTIDEQARRELIAEMRQVAGRP